MNVNYDSEEDLDKLQAEEDRDAFAQRIREKDKKNTRKIVSKHEALATAEAEAAKRFNIADGDDKGLIKSAR